MSYIAVESTQDVVTIFRNIVEEETGRVIAEHVMFPAADAIVEELNRLSASFPGSRPC